jgi:hypothetical protein
MQWFTNPRITLDVTCIKPTQNELSGSSWLKILIAVRIPSIFWAELSKSPQAEFATKKPPGTLIPGGFSSLILSGSKP